MLVLKFVFWLSFISFASVVFSIEYESKIELSETSELSAIEVVNKDLVRHEGNMNSDMEGEVVTEAAVLIVKANYTISTALANELKQHLSGKFDGTWSVVISDGHIYASNENAGSKYVRFSYTNKMILVTQKFKSAGDEVDEEELMKNARGKTVRIIYGQQYGFTLKLKAEIERLLSTKSFKSFDQLIHQLYPIIQGELYPIPKPGNIKWAIIMCYNKCERYSPNNFGVYLEVNAMHIHIH